jgi:hypothetical protein
MPKFNWHSGRAVTQNQKTISSGKAWVLTKHGMRKMKTLKELVVEHEALVEAYLELAQQLKDERATPDEDSVEVARVYAGRSRDTGHQVISFGFYRDFESPEEQISILSSLMFALYNMIRVAQGREPLHGHVEEHLNVEVLADEVAIDLETIFPDGIFKKH